MNKWDPTELKVFCAAQETTSKVKRQPSGWEETVANETTGGGLVSRIYEQFMQLNTRKTNNPITK